MANNSLDLITDHDDLINLPPPPHATSPLRETQIERKYKLPGFETLRAVHYDGTEQSVATSTWQLISSAFSSHVAFISMLRRILPQRTSGFGVGNSCTTTTYTEMCGRGSDNPLPPHSNRIIHGLLEIHKTNYANLSLISLNTSMMNSLGRRLSRVYHMSLSTAAWRAWAQDLFWENCPREVAKRGIICQEGRKGEGTYRERGSWKVSWPRTKWSWRICPIWCRIDGRCTWRIVKVGNAYVLPHK